MTSSKIDLDNFSCRYRCESETEATEKFFGNTSLLPDVPCFRPILLARTLAIPSFCHSAHGECGVCCGFVQIDGAIAFQKCMVALVWHKSLLSKEISRLLEKCKGWILGWILTQHRSAGAPICHQSLPTSVAFNGDFSVGFHWLFRGPGHCPGHWSDLG